MEDVVLTEIVWDSIRMIGSSLIHNLFIQTKLDDLSENNKTAQFRFLLLSSMKGRVHEYEMYFIGISILLHFSPLRTMNESCSNVRVSYYS